MLKGALGLVMITLAGCASPPRVAPPPPPALAVSELKAEEVPAPIDIKPLATEDIRTMSCATLLGASDDDRAYASTFLVGYRSALTHKHMIDVKKIEAIEDAALAQCSRSPAASANKVFTDALLKLDKPATPAMQYSIRRGQPDQPLAAPVAPTR